MKWFIVLLLGVFLAGCEKIKEEATESYFEQAKVLQTIFTPPTHQNATRTNIEPRIKYDFLAGKFKTVWVPISKDVLVEVPARYGIVFECQHGKFVVEGTAEKHKNLWGRMKEDEKVIVEYREIYRNTYNSDGQKIKSELIKLDFIDAKPGVLPLEAPQ